MTEQTQLDRIEAKLNAIGDKVEAHHTDLAWIKRIVGAAGSMLALAVAHLLRKVGIG